jgi:hypothetical protein
VTGTPLRSLAAEAVQALREDRSGVTFILALAWLGMWSNDMAFLVDRGMDSVSTIAWAIGTSASGMILCVLLCALFLAPPFPPGARPALLLATFAVSGAYRALVLGLVFLPGAWDAIAWLAAARALTSVVWLSTGTMLDLRLRQARDQRSLLTTEHRRLVQTRARTAAAVAATDAELGRVRASTRTAIADLSRRLVPGVDAASLSECIDLIDRLVDREVRPISHDLARMPDELAPSEVGPQRVPGTMRSLLRSWRLGEPFQPLLVGVVCLPVVVGSVLAIPPHQFVGTVMLQAMAAFALQLVMLLVARFVVEPRLAGMSGRAAVATLACVYAVMFVVGVVGVIAGCPGLVEPHLLPPSLAAILGGVAAATAQRQLEADAAARMVRLTDLELRQSRLRLWAQRRRLAVALHGRVQANLTAAGLLLQQGRDELLSTGRLDAGLMNQVRVAMEAAERIDTRTPGSVRDRLEQVALVWAGIMDVRLDLAPEAEVRLTDDVDAADACVEAVRELFLNAVRHGGAVAAAVQVGVAGPDLVSIGVTEHAPRERVEAAAGQGMGHSLLDSLAVTWATREEAGARTTTVLLAAGSPALPTL